MAYIQTDEVYQQIKMAIADKTPFSLIRLGDGEARLIGYPEHVAKRELDKSLDYWYGPFKPTNGDVMRLRAELVTACQNADVLGLPSREQTERNGNYQLVHYLAMKHGLARGDTTHCGVHRWLASEGFLADLLRGLPKVTLITCRDVMDVFAELGIKHVHWIPVPTEGQTGKPESRHYPDRHSEVLREIDAGPGDVFLVGAGPNGKCYCDAVKRDGGIGLDLGSIFDAWARIPSRSYISQEPERYSL